MKGTTATLLEETVCVVLDAPELRVVELVAPELASTELLPATELVLFVDDIETAVVLEPQPTKAKDSAAVREIIEWNVFMVIS